MNKATESSSFERAIDAMREPAVVSDDRAAAVRAAIVRAASVASGPAARRRSARRRALTTTLLFAAAIGGSAFAATRWIARPAVAVERVALPASTPARPVAHRAHASPVIRTQPLSPAPSAESIVVVASPSPSSPRATTPRAPTRVVASRSAIARTERDPVVSVLPTDEPLYRAAHEAHFAQRDMAAALARWEQYLRAAPEGRFAPEAQFNRVVCLARLGRRSEALEALRSLPSGHYRHADAERLRAHLEGQP